MQAGSILSNKRRTLLEQDREAPHPVRLFYEATSDEVSIARMQ
jgi:hypothetical protein